MKWEKFRDPVSGQTWMEPVHEPSDEPKLSPELVAEGERLAAKAAALTLEIKAATERLAAEGNFLRGRTFPTTVVVDEVQNASFAALDESIKAARERLSADITAKLAALAPTEEEWAKSLFANETEADDTDTLERPQEDAWTDFEGDHLTDGKGYAAASVYRRCRAAFDAAWPQGREAAMAAALEAFKASGS